MDSQPNSTRQEHGKKWIFIISGIILFLIVTIIGTTIITCNKQYSWNSSSNQAELPYSQSSQFLVTGSLSVEPPSPSEDFTLAAKGGKGGAHTLMGSLGETG